jgi:hypothetical protein
VSVRLERDEAVVTRSGENSGPGQALDDSAVLGVDPHARWHGHLETPIQGPQRQRPLTTPQPAPRPQRHGESSRVYATNIPAPSAIDTKERAVSSGFSRALCRTRTGTPSVPIRRTVRTLAAVGKHAVQRRSAGSRWAREPTGPAYGSPRIGWDKGRMGAIAAQMSARRHVAGTPWAVASSADLRGRAGCACRQCRRSRTSLGTGSLVGHVMDQMGHEDAGFTLGCYRKAMKRGTASWSD